MKTLLKYLALIGAITGLATAAKADVAMYVYDFTSNTGQWISDGQAGLDINSVTDTITYNGTVGMWNLQVSTGISYGNATNPILHLNTIVGNLGPDSTGGSIGVGFFGNGYGPSDGVVASGISVNTPGSVWFSTYGGNSNTLDDLSNMLTSATYTGVKPRGTQYAPITADGPYSLASWVVITHGTGNQVTSVDATMTVPDGGTTALLLGLGLLGLVGASRRSKAVQV